MPGHIVRSQKQNIIFMDKNVEILFSVHDVILK
jgi:hypothetical protein